MNRFTDIQCGNQKLPPVGCYWNEKTVTIEKSLNFLRRELEELDRTITYAKSNCHYPSEHQLTHDESAAIYLYTMESGDNSVYRKLNDVLRLEDRRAAVPWFSFLKIIDSALKKLPAVKSSIWRGVPGHVGKNFKRNQELIWWTLSSCSTQVDIIKVFLKGSSTLFMIDALNGKDISAYSSFPSEHEVMLPPGTRLRVKGEIQDPAGGIHIIHLTEDVSGPPPNEGPSMDGEQGQRSPSPDSMTCPFCHNTNVSIADRCNPDRAVADRAFAKGGKSFIGQKTHVCFFVFKDLVYICTKRHA